MRQATPLSLSLLLSGVLGCVGGPIVGAECLEGLSACPGGCYDLAEDDFNCGACGNACAIGEICVAGECATCAP